MINFLDKIIKQFKVNNKILILDKNKNGNITMKFEIFHSILDYILKDNIIFKEAEIEFDEVDSDETLYRLFIIVEKGLNSISENKLKIIKKKIMSSFKENGFDLINVIITSKENLKE